MPKKRIQYRYSSTGQRSALVDPDGGRFTYAYDSLKRLTQVLNPQAQRTTFAYDNAGRRTLKKLANGSRTSFTYDAANRLTSVAQLKSDASVQAKYEYKYDKAGNRTAMAETGVSTARTTWSYDAAYQLTGEHRTGANAFRNTYTYDNRGNRLLKNLDGTRTTSSYDDANQLRWTQDGSGRTTYTFDADGNQQVVLTPAGQRTTSVWDYENKLTGVLNPSGTRETLAYDPDGKRVKQQTASDTAKYVWDQENYLQEADASNVTQATFTNEPRTYGNLISQRRSSATHYYVFDALGSTRLLTNSAEAVSESLLYDAWGNLITAAPTLAVPFRWVGELGYLFVPTTADYYIRARVYRPNIGRWSSVDPLGVILTLFSSVYSYSKNNAPKRRDPSGMITVEPVDTTRPSEETRLGTMNCPSTPDASVMTAAYWRFRLDHTAPCAGYLVQQIEVHCDVSNCINCPNKTPVEPGLVFWEAFPVWIYHRDFIDVSFGASDYGDRSRREIRNGSCGVSSAVGTIKFFCKSREEAVFEGEFPVTGDLALDDKWRKNALYPVPNCADFRISPDDIMSTLEKPTWWEQTPWEETQAPIEEVSHRSMSVFWNCCGCKDSGITAIANPAL